MTYFMNYIKDEAATKKSQEISAKYEYDKLKNSNLSEYDLQEELKNIDQQIELVKKQIPSNLRYQDVNQMLSEITSNTGRLFNLGNCNISNAKDTKDSDNVVRYITYDVKISSLSGSYTQILNLLEYIKQYNVKVNISQLELSRDGEQMKGSMTLVFYGEKQSEG